MRSYRRALRRCHRGVGARPGASVRLDRNHNMILLKPFLSLKIRTPSRFLFSMNLRYLVLLATVAAVVGAVAPTAEAWQGRTIRGPLRVAVAFAEANRYRRASFTEYATALRPCEPLPASPQRFECDVMFLGDSHLSGELLPLRVLKSRGHVCVFDPGEEAGVEQCAQPDYGPDRRRTVARLSVAASNGYTFVAERFDRTLTIGLRRGDTEATYELLARGPAGGNQIVATVPGLLDINVHFHARGPVDVLPKSPHCPPNVTRHRRGVFVGRVRFFGEGGFTDTNASRARGFLNHRLRSRCRRPSREAVASSLDRRPTQTIELGGEGGTILRRLNFGAAKGPYPLFAPLDYDNSGRRYFYAKLFENGYEVDVSRKIEVKNADPRSFVVDAALTSATVTPPWPFRGAGQLEQEHPVAFLEPDPLWSGDLTVSFPGAPEVPLIGPGLEASLREVLW